MPTLTDLVSGVPALLPYLPYLVLAMGVCALLMPWLPPPANPRSVYGLVYAVVNAMAQNYRNARNAPVAPATPSTQVTK